MHTRRRQFRNSSMNKKQKKQQQPNRKRTTALFRAHHPKLQLLHVTIEATAILCDDCASRFWHICCNCVLLSLNLLIFLVNLWTG